jgi:transcriptional regulator with XRE-family HTH domain
MRRDASPRIPSWSTNVADTALHRLATSRGRALGRSLGEQLRDLREEREVSLRELSAASGVHPAVIGRAETGEGNLTLESIAKIATALGAEPSLRLYPATGPRLRDHLQVRLIETLLERLHGRWRARLEVPVYRTARGVIDLVLAEATAQALVAGEAHSEIRRAERQVRWAAEKVDALPSADGWPWMDSKPRTSRLLILRSTAATRSMGRRRHTSSRRRIRVQRDRRCTRSRVAPARSPRAPSCGSISEAPPAGCSTDLRAGSGSGVER